MLLLLYTLFVVPPVDSGQIVQRDSSYERIMVREDSVERENPNAGGGLYEKDWYNHPIWNRRGGFLPTFFDSPWNRRDDA